MTDSTPDRPHALLSDADLCAQLDVAFEKTIAERSRANSRAYCELLAEWEHRISLSVENYGIPF